MKRAALEFDPKAQLLRILEDYPGGQLVSEAVQNAEDGGASQFTLLLDLRHHAIEHQAIAGPAFVLIDNGRGFSEREWTSLRAVNKSEKRSSPSEIGAFGMGSRSYFHYSDVTLVASRGQYGGIDPLKVLPGRDGGWHASLSEGEIQAEADALFSPGVAGLCEGFDRMQRGALIRLPLRREQDVLREQEQSDDGQPLAPEITVARAEELFAQWADSAPRLLLFLTSMRRVSFYRWRSGAAQPELVADTNKKYLRGEPRPRLPPSLPDNVTRTYTELRDHILGLSASERAALSATQEAVVRVELSQPAPRGASRSVSAIDWFVCERLDFITPSVLGAMQKGCCRNATPVIPVVGIAMPLTADGVPFVGVPYCFLPIGQMRTGLPVQVNGSFRPTPNRRELWLPGEELDGNHEKFALWNEVLMNDAVPALWLAALRNLASAGIATTAGGIATTAGRQFDILSVLPDLAAVDNVWRPCAEKLYTLISGEPLLPHSGSRQWVMPREALGVVAPAALASQVKGVMRLYERCPDPALREQVALVSASAAPSAQAASTSRANCVVTLPKHVLDGCERFSALRRVRIDHVLRCVLRADRSAFEGPTAVDQLRPILLALMSYAGQAPFSSAEHGEWRGELAGVPWVETSGGATVKLSAAFAPSDALAKWQLGVVGSNTAQLGASDAATTLAGIAWGLKPGLSWADCVAEAQMIEKDRDRPLAERVAWAERLIKYLEHSFGTVGLFGPCEDEEATKCRALLSAIAFCPAVEPSGRFDSAASLEGTLCLRPPSSMQSSSNAPFVWAVEPRAKVSATLLRFAKLSVEVVVRQIIALSSMPAPSAEASVLSQHLLSAARRLSQFPPAELSPLSDSELGARLREAAWVPGMGGGKMGGGDQLRFFPPGRVAHQLHGDLWPRFGRLPDDWRAGLSTFLQTLGVKQTLSAAVLAAELRDVAGEGQHSKRFALSIRMAAELAAALEAGAAAPDEVFVPTTDGRLLPAAHVFINDAPWHSRAAGAATQALLHEAVSPADGKRLGCSSVREELARLCEGEGEVEGEVFGQSERLSTRIENLLLKYNDEKDLFVEHLQNCNDAGASKVLFMFDHGSYDAMSVIAPGHEALQGPALVLASSRALDDNDLLRIRQLGSSEKRKQFAQAGRFGLGLNSLYHLSDTPQIFAKNLAFVVLDPLHKLGGEDGMRYIPARLQENFPSMLAPFAAVPKEYPTVFRLPLRMLGPSSFGRKWSAKAAFDLLSRFIELQKSELLLFSKSVTQVVVDVRSSDGSVARLREIARTDTVDDDDTPLQSPRKSPRVAKRTAVAATSQAPVYVSSPFMQRLPTTFEEVRQLQGSPRDSIERVTIVIESPDAAPVKERWLIAHSLAVDGDGLGLIRDEEDHARAERDQDDGRAAVHARPAVGGSGRVGVACRIPKRWCGAGVGVVRLCRAGSAYRPLKSRPSVWNPTLSPRPFARRAAL